MCNCGEGKIEVDIKSILKNGENRMLPKNDKDKEKKIKKDKKNKKSKKNKKNE